MVAGKAQDDMNVYAIRNTAEALQVKGYDEQGGDGQGMAPHRVLELEGALMLPTWLVPLLTWNTSGAAINGVPLKPGSWILRLSGRPPKVSVLSQREFTEFWTNQEPD